MASSKVETHFARYRTSHAVRLYALLDGLLYARAAPSEPLVRSQSAAALFDGTPDAALAEAGPWLIDWDRAEVGLRSRLDELAASATGLSWLVSTGSLESLAQALRERLDIRMPDGRLVWLRFHDARIMARLSAMLLPTQRAKFFAPVVEWLVQVDGALTRVHSRV